MRRLTVLCVGLVSALGHAVVAFAGPVILGGDDLADHGSFNGSSNVGGWLYVEKSVESILEPATNITRPNDGSIAALGSESSIANSSDPGAAIRRVGLVLGKTVNFYNGAAEINQFFADLATATEMPAMIWIAGEDNDESNTLDADEAAALNSNAAAIASFVNSGGGLMSHGCDSSDDTCEIGAYDWLSTLLPGLIVQADCENDGAALTPAGQAAFPGLSNSNIDVNAGGNCHNHFTGNFGSLQVLALDGEVRPMILGGGAGTTIQDTSDSSVPALSHFGLALLTLLLFGFGTFAARRRRLPH